MTDTAGPTPETGKDAEQHRRALKPSEIFGRQLKKSRRRRDWTQDKLAKRMKDLGMSIDRASIAKIEQGKRGVSVDEALALSLALGVAPIHLLMPRSRGVWWIPGEKIATGTPKPPKVALAPLFTEQSLHAAAWLTGQFALHVREEETPDTTVAYYSHVSDHDNAIGRWPALFSLRKSMQQLELQAFANSTDALNLIEDIRDDLDRLEKQLRRHHRDDETVTRIAHGKDTE